MVYIVFFIIFFSFVQLLVALVNFLYRNPFSGIKISVFPLVSVLIPARNEEENIGNLLKDLSAQDYQNMEIIVFNDQSTDTTAEIVESIGKADPQIKLIHSDGLPDGWLGKNYACHKLSEHAKGEYFLFLDADVRITGDIIAKTINYSQKNGLALVSIFPKQEMVSLGEKITVPNMNYILLSLLPLVLVRKSASPSLAAANGQFMLFQAATYYAIRPHEQMKGCKVEDIEIARWYKHKRIAVACLTGNNTVRCRMYQDFTGAVNGFSKNVTSFFGNSFVLAFLFWLLTTFGFIAVFYGAGLHVGLLYLAILLFTKVLVSIASRQSVFTNLLLWPLQQLALGLFIYRAFLNKFNKNYQWKGRNIS